jgi:hypothetical protein
MLRVSPYASFWLGGQESERTTMGNGTLAQELLSSDELDELYKLDASESAPEEDEDDGEDDDGEDVDEDEDDEDGGGPFEPKDIPHG